MLESFLITLREGVEIALIIGILLVYLNRIGKVHLKKAVFIGLALSLVASILGAIILEKISLDYEYFEGYLVFVAAAFVTTMIIWMWRTSRQIKHEIEEKVNSLVKHENSSWRVHFGIMLFTFFMMTREGIETVIFLRAVSTGGGLSAGSIGIAAGILAALIFAWFFVKGSLRIDIGRFLKVTAVVLMIFVVQLLVNGVHEFYELGVFPANPKMMGIIGPIVRNNLFFILAIISIPAIMFIIPGRKKAIAVSATRNRKWQLAAGFISLSVIFFLGFDDIFTSRSSIEISPPKKILHENGIIQLPVEHLLDGRLHRFVWTDNDGTQIRFFALRTGTGSFATAFDACRACYNYGFFYLKDRELICSICEAPSDMSKLAVATQDDEQNGSMEGMGCAPLYLPSRLQGEFVTVKTAELQKNKRYFQTSFDSGVLTFAPTENKPSYN